MNPRIDEEISNFKALQGRYSGFGAEDSEPDYVFQLILARAIVGGPRPEEDEIDWDLYENPGVEEAWIALTEQALRVFDRILAEAGDSDRKAIRDLCWRLDESEFEY